MFCFGFFLLLVTFAYTEIKSQDDFDVLIMVLKAKFQKKLNGKIKGGTHLFVIYPLMI